MDPVILADILTALLVIALVVAPTWLVVCWAGRAVARKRARLVEPSTYGDDGGRPVAVEMQQATMRPTASEMQRAVSHPKAPDIGSGLPAGAWDRSATLRPWKAGD